MIVLKKTQIQNNKTLVGATARTNLDPGELALSLELEWWLRLPHPSSGDQLLSDKNPRREKFRRLITLPEFESIPYTL
jgi:hypothetical protein